MASPNVRKLPSSNNARRGSGNKIVIRELEERFKGRQNSDHLPKFGDLSRVSPVTPEEGRRNSKSLTEKRMIHETLLQARAKWVAQNREREDERRMSATEEGEGRDFSQESPVSEKSNFTQSMEATNRFCIDANDSSPVVMRTKRAYSNSALNNQRIIPAPPKSRPPVISKAQKAGALEGVGTTASPSVAAGQKRGGGKNKGKLGAGKGAAVKKILGFIGGKGKNSNNAKQVGAKVSKGGAFGSGSSSGGAGNYKRAAVKKTLSETSVVQHSVPTAVRRVPHTTSDSSLLPSSEPGRGYNNNNVFDDPNYSTNWRQQQQQREDASESRSGTNSPTDFSQKPKPLPRKNMRNSLGSNQDTSSDTETLSPFSPRVMSPLQVSTTADSDSQTPRVRSPRSVSPRPVSSRAAGSGLKGVITIPEQQDPWQSREDKLMLSASSNSSAKLALGKTASLNPQGSGDSNVGQWGPVTTRKSTTRQKLLRKGVFSDGDREDLDDDYIKMSSICGSFAERASMAGPPVSITGTDSTPATNPNSLGIPTNPGGFLASSLPNVAAAGRRYQGLNIPTDDKRASNYYMKIICGETSSSLPSIPPTEQLAELGSDDSDDDVELYVEVSKEDLRPSIPVTRKLRKENTVPILLPSVAVKNSEDLVSKSIPIHGFHAHTTGSVTPPPLKQSCTKDSPSNLTPPNKQGKKFQYTEVTINSESTKKRVPSIPKKFKYQMVNLLEESGGAKFGISKDPTDSAASESTDPVVFEISDDDDDYHVDMDLTLFPKGSHPLLNLPSTSSSPSTSSPASPAGGKKERSYYINRQSLIAMESCKDLPTTMLSTLDPVTGKVIWHEYVEIDEDQLDKMANSVGVAKSTPIPEKLSMLLGVPPSSSAGVAKSNKGQGPTTVETARTKSEASKDSAKSEKPRASLDLNVPPVEEQASCSPQDDESLSQDSTCASLCSSTSSECNYVFNLNEPPTVPPRPDDLDALVEQLKRTSDDYSYAMIPDRHLFGKHWMKVKARNVTKPPRKVSNENTSQQQKGSATSKAAKGLSPPSLPPKSNSLLREQELKHEGSPEPYLLPIIVKTKKKGTQKSQDKKSPDKPPKGAATFVSYIRDRISPASSPRGSESPPSKRHTSPPKPIPYKEHQKRKKQLTISAMKAAEQQASAPVTEEAAITGPTHLQKTAPQQISGNHRPLHGHGRQLKTHKKLARQSYRGSHKIKSHQTGHRRANIHPPTDGVAQGGVQRGIRRKPSRKGPRLEAAKQESLEMIMRNSGVLVEQLGLDVTEKEGSETPSDKNESIEPAEESRKQVVSKRGLSEIFVEISRLLKDSHCSEDDLLSAIESHFNLKVKKAAQARAESEGASQEESSGAADAQDTDSIEELEDAQNAGTPETLDSTEGEENPSASKPKPPYVNLVFGEDDEGEAMQTNQGSNSKPYVNIEIPDNNDDSSLPYVNMEFPDNNDSSQDACDDYIEPSEALTDQNPLSIWGKKYFSPKNVPKICVLDEKREVCPLTSPGDQPRVLHTSTSQPAVRPGKTPTPTPRVRSKSSVTSPPHDQTSDDIQKQMEGPQMIRNPEGESSLDFGSAAKRPRTPEPAATERAQLSREEIRRGSVDMLSTGQVLEKTSSYHLALEMEERRLTRSLEVVREEEEEESENTPKRSKSANKSLQRTNALNRRKNSGYATYSTGIGSFSHKGGRLLNAGSGVTIEVPEGAVPKGTTQKIWFKVAQDVYDPSKDEDLAMSLSESGSFELESHLQEKREKRVQLSPVVEVGPLDAALLKPIVIRIPHCLPYRNNSWHLQMLGRALNRESTKVGSSSSSGSNGDREERWSEIMNTFGLVEALPSKGSSGAYRKRSTYQMHLEYVQVKTSQLGHFKLVGRPIRNGTYAAKKMVASVYSKPLPSKESLQFDIFINNAIDDQSNALDASLTSHGHMPLIKNMPILCFGDGKDMEITLSNDSNTAIPLGTKAIPFGLLWRHNKVGQSHVIFDIETDLVEDDRTLTLKIQQAGSKLYHETNFILHDL